MPRLAWSAVSAFGSVGLSLESPRAVAVNRCAPAFTKIVDVRGVLLLTPTLARSGVTKYS